MKIKKINYLLIATTFLMVSCADKDNHSALATNNEITRMSPEERKAKVPNQAFEAVYLKSKSRVLEILDSNQSLFVSYNELGLTPLMVAIELREPEISLLITDRLSYKDLQAHDDNGQGYISYAAQYGNISVIEKIAEKYKASLKFGMARFHNIDFKNTTGQHALFYAANSSVAKRLEDFWMQWTVTRGASKTFWSGFYNKTDNLEQNFLHTAATDNRHDLLQWAMDKVCAPIWLQDTDFLFGGARFAGKAIDYAIGLSQRTPLVPDDLVNKKDMAGNTPLHLAVRAGHLEASKSLMTCRLIHYRSTNIMGRNPLSELLSHLDSKQALITENYKQIFETLITKENYLSLTRNFNAKMINDQDIDGHSALHFAAKLMDPYFYLKLKNRGDVYLLSNSGETPHNLFSSRHPGL